MVLLATPVSVNPQELENLSVVWINAKLNQSSPDIKGIHELIRENIVTGKQIGRAHV